MPALSQKPVRAFDKLLIHTQVCNFIFSLSNNMFLTLYVTKFCSVKFLQLFYLQVFFFSPSFHIHTVSNTYQYFYIFFAKRSYYVCVYQQRPSMINCILFYIPPFVSSSFEFLNLPLVFFPVLQLLLRLQGKMYLRLNKFKSNILCALKFITPAYKVAVA